MRKSKNIFSIIGLNVFISILIFYFVKQFLILETHMFEFYSNFSIEQVNGLIEQQKKWEWLGYAIIPIIYLLKISIISICIFSGLFFFNKKAKFSQLFNAVVLADMILLLPQIIKIVWFSFQSDYTLEDIQYFFPGSALSMFDPTQVQKWLLYPLQALNIFELGFWLLLAYQLKEYFEGDFTESFKNVALSYGSSYMVWVLFVMFLTLNYAP
jgi:uncharacterized membrane protein